MRTTRLLGRKARRHAGGGFSGTLAGLAAGAGLMYFLDPRGGAWRRSQAVQRASRALRDAEETVEAGARDLRQRARGLAHEARARASREHVDDEVLAERVRARLGRLASHPRALQVAARQGRVELSGPIFSAEHGRVIRGVWLVRGVRAVEDRLDPHETAAEAPSLQGAGPKPGPRPQPLQRAWSPGTKLLATAGGALLVGRALFGKGFVRLPAGLFGAALVRRAMAHAGAVTEDGRRLARAASAAANRAREARGERQAHSGGWHPEPEVREVKSPAELEPGIASASPRPTFSNRVDRGGHDGERGGNGGRRPGGGEGRGGGGGGGGGWTASGEQGIPGSGDVTPGASYLAPDAGTGVREADLGAMSPPDVGVEPELGAGDEGTTEDLGGGAARADEPGGPPRRDPSDERG
jgi:hypothetical protein